MRSASSSRPSRTSTHCRCLQRALQNAIELEHATLPTYLYALWSLSDDKNPEIFSLIRPIVMQEMSHFGLAGNVVTAIGGHPGIADPAFVPSYPGPLPGGLEGGLIVPLAPFAIDLVGDVFMAIAPGAGHRGDVDRARRRDERRADL